VKHLKRGGFIEHSSGSSNGRSGGFVVTPTGGKVVERLRPILRAAHDRIMAPLSDREREMLLDLLARVIKAEDVKSGGGS
jgi:DNA-binding MarR family transcriptional regulator